MGSRSPISSAAADHADRSVVPGRAAWVVVLARWGQAWRNRRDLRTPLARGWARRRTAPAISCGSGDRDRAVLAGIYLLGLLIGLSGADYDFARAIVWPIR